jgi:hypothetical protein
MAPDPVLERIKKRVAFSVEYAITNKHLKRSTVVVITNAHENRIVRKRVCGFFVP